MCWFLCCSWAAATPVLFACRAASADAPANADLHGAAPSDEQLSALGKLLNGSVGPPDEVDAVVWTALVPTDNDTNAERIALGRKLYFDTRLSADQTLSCATCHDVKRSFTDRRATSEGIQGQLGKRNAPTTMNAALLGLQFWDGRARTLEDQAKLPILNPIEMGMPSDEAAVAAIANDPEYQRMFQAAYGRGANFEDMARAIAAFERTLIFLDAPVDRYFAGNHDAVGEAARRGWILYNGKARCTACHPLNQSNLIGSDDRFHNVGVSARHQNFEALATQALRELAKDPSMENLERLALETDMSELGRFMVTKDYSDIGAFRTPQVRNVGITGPYMHDGSMETLWDVMDHYNRGGEANPYLDGGIEPLGLSEQEIDDVVAFMFTLTDSRFAELNDAEMMRQRQIANEKRPFRENDLAHRRRILFDPRAVPQPQ